MSDTSIEQRVRALIVSGEVDQALRMWSVHKGLAGDAAGDEFRRRFKSHFRLGDTIEARAPRSSQASARFGEHDAGETSAYEAGQIWLGRDPADSAVGFRDDRHVITIAGSRAGKGASAIIPNLCDYPGSVLCIDPKGENATITSRRRGAGSEYSRGMGQKVVVLDPFGVADAGPDAIGAFNPLDLIDPFSDDALDQANAIAEALVVETDPRDAHWNESAKQLLAALMLFVKSIGSPQEQTLGNMRDILSRGLPMPPGAGLPDELDIDIGIDVDVDVDVGEAERPAAAPTFSGFEAVLALMRESSVAPAVAIAATLGDMGDGERGSVLSAARRNTAFLDSPRVRKVLGSSTFRLEELKTLPGGLSVYLCLPVKELSNHKRWLRLLAMLALERIEREGQRPPATGHPVLFLLDEFASLGHMRPLEVAVGFIAGYGIKLWCVLQDLQQLQGIYKDSWATFLGNAGIIQCFANSDPATLDYLSKRLGDTELRQIVRSESRNRSRSSSSSESVSKTAGSSKQTSRDASMVRAPRGLIFRGKRQSQSDGRGSSASSERSETRGSSRESSETEGEDEGMSEVIAVAPLMRPDEIEREFSRDSGKQLVIVSGQFPLVLRRTPYFSDPHFEAKFDPSPAHPDSDPPTLAQREQWAREEAQRESRRLSELPVDAQPLAGGDPATSPRSRRALALAAVFFGALLLGALALSRFAGSGDSGRTPVARAAPAVAAPLALARPSAEPTPGALTSGEPIAIAALEANVRAAPQPGAARLGSLARGAMVRGADRENGFVRVAAGSGLSGWVSERLVMTPAGFERLRMSSAEEYLRANNNAARSRELMSQLDGLGPRLARARQLMLAGSDDAREPLAAMDRERAFKISADTDAANWFSASARVLDGKAESDASLLHWLAAVVADPSDIDNLTAYALGCFKQSRLDELSKVSPMLLLLAPQTTNAWLIAGIADAIGGRPREAASALAYAIKVSKNAQFTRRFFSELAEAPATDPRVAAALREAL